MMRVESLFTRGSWQGRLQHKECKRKESSVVGERRELIVYIFTIDLVRTCCYSGDGRSNDWRRVRRVHHARAPGSNLIVRSILQASEGEGRVVGGLVDGLEESVVCNKPCP